MGSKIGNRGSNGLLANYNLFVSPTWQVKKLYFWHKSCILLRKYYSGRPVLACLEIEAGVWAELGNNR